MAITQIEVVKGFSNGANPGVSVATLGTASTAGELITALVVTSTSGGGSGQPPATVTDNLSQTYSSVFFTVLTNTGIFGVGLYRKENSASGVTSVTVTNAANDQRGGVFVGHYTSSGTLTLDQSAAPVDASGDTSPWTSPTITTTAAEELWVGVELCLKFAGGADPTITPSVAGGWTKDAEIRNADDFNFNGNNGHAAVYAHQIVAAIGTNVAHTGTDDNGTCDNYAGIATFKLPAGGGATTAQVLPAWLQAQLEPWGVQNV